MTDPLQQAQYTRLHPERTLWLNGRECLALRFPHAGCHACADECPAGALLQANGTWTLTHACVGCGRCAARCPTDALTVTGFDRNGSSPPPGHPLRVDCARVPAGSTPKGALRVPCLGGLGTDGLLRLVAGSPYGVRLLDRSLCAECPAGGDAFPPVGDALDTANALLDEMAVPAERRIGVEPRPLRDAPRPPTPAPGSHGRPVSRRDLWKALASEAVRARDAAQAPRPPASVGSAPLPDGRARVTPRKRLAVIARLRALDETRARPLPARLRPSLAIAPTCRDHNLCVRLCPTGALELQESGSRKAVRFDPDRCIACAACIHACPGGAIGWQEKADDVSTGPRTLITHETRTCGECGADFVQRGMAEENSLPTCPDCQKSRRLMQSVFSDLFASHHG
jgi:ferredoxin